MAADPICPHLSSPSHLHIAVHLARLTRCSVLCAQCSVLILLILVAAPAYHAGFLQALVIVN